MLLLGDRRAGRGVAAVRVGDRLALDADLLAAARAPSARTCSVTTYLRSRARPLSRLAVPTRSSSSERVIASSVVGPLVSWPTVSRPLPRGSPESERASE